MAAVKPTRSGLRCHPPWGAGPHGPDSYECGALLVRERSEQRRRDELHCDGLSSPVGFHVGLRILETREQTDADLIPEPPFVSDAGEQREATATVVRGGELIALARFDVCITDGGFCVQTARGIGVPIHEGTDAGRAQIAARRREAAHRILGARNGLTIDSAANDDPALQRLAERELEAGTGARHI